MSNTNTKIEQTELVIASHAPGAIARQESAGEALLRMAADPAIDAAKARELLAVRREWMADEAAAAFNAAVVRFQQRCAVIAKLDQANGRGYAAMDRIWRSIRPLLEECGLAVTWESVKSAGDGCILDGHLRHAQGHVQALHHEMPLPDKINGQNSAQRAGSGETYSKRYATCAALGVQTGKDDDGNGGGGSGPAVTPDQLAQLKAWIVETKTMLAPFLGWGGVNRLEDFPAAKFTEAKASFVRKGVKA